ncbi:hypothetical protein B0H63DRAFT_560124 [Podospora didyma]|uniref:Uncharacterized protein n=1 Tax=Podospora didyma TaxID=330526 RepID=A0AAE0NQ72_9PEZI|nr:hypothetical protein B0H63DRAFT_560124 [Podospora didyma]
MNSSEAKDKTKDLCARNTSFGCITLFRFLHALIAALVFALYIINLVSAASAFDPSVCSHRDKGMCTLTLFLACDKSDFFNKRRAELYNNECVLAGSVDGLVWNQVFELPHTAGGLPKTTLKINPHVDDDCGKGRGCRPRDTSEFWWGDQHFVPEDKL